MRQGVVVETVATDVIHTEGEVLVLVKTDAIDSLRVVKNAYRVYRCLSKSIFSWRTREIKTLPSSWMV